MKSFVFATLVAGVGCQQNPEATDGVTYYRDVAPLVAEHCVRCHQDDGVGFGDFTDPEQVEALSAVMAGAVEEQRMPPPVSSPACRDFTGSGALMLDESERELFATWARDGYRMGEAPEDDPEPPPDGSLDAPDLELLIPSPYTPEYADPEFADNEYRCFVMDPQLQESAFVTALAPIVDEASVLHHAVLTLADRSGLSDEQLAPDGYDCAGGMGLDPSNRPLVAWAPGMLPIELEDGLGIRVDENQVFILQIHYYASPGTTNLADQSGYAFRIADEVETEVTMTQMGLLDFEIPAGDAAYEAGGSYSPPFDKEILGIFPHMHRLGDGYHAELSREDGTTECLLDGRFDFDNQLTYQFGEPVNFSPTDSLSFQCRWNNSDSNPALDGPPVATGFGERTDEEMCFFFMLTADVGEAVGPPAVDPVDPDQLEANSIQVNIVTDVAGMLVMDTCTGEIEISSAGESVTGQGGCAFKGPFTMLLGADPFPVDVEGTVDSGTVSIDIQGSAVEADYMAQVEGGELRGNWAVQDSQLNLGAEISIFHTGGFRAGL